MSAHRFWARLRFLKKFKRLEELILDHNELTVSRLKLPALPMLTTLWLNNNALDDLAAVIAAVRSAAPRLEHLSLLGNPLAPNYMNGGSVLHYISYRHRVIVQLPGLVSLDCSVITADERDGTAT